MLLLTILILRGLNNSDPSMPSIGAVVVEVSKSGGTGSKSGGGGEKAVENKNGFGCCNNTMEAMPRRRSGMGG